MTAARPRVLAVVLGFIPSTMIAVVKPLMNLHRGGKIDARIVLESQAAEDDIAWADAIVFCRNTEPRYAPLLAAIRARGTPLIYDLDDNLFELPPDCEDGARLRAAPRQAMLEAYLRAAALVRVYSSALARRVAAFNPWVVRTPAPIDLSLVPPPAETRPPGPIKIVYATSRTQDALSGIFQPALARIASRYEGRIEIHFWGCRPPRNAALRSVHYHGLVRQYNRYLWRFSRGGYDIGLAPLPDDLFYRSKSNNKFREYGASGIAGVYSDNDVYADCVQHEVNGLLVENNAESWFGAIARLIEDQSLRSRIQRQARQYVEEHHAQEKFDRLFLDQLHGVLSRPAGSAGVPGASIATATCPSAMPRFVHRFCHLARRSLEICRLGPRPAWTALRWFVSDRCFAAWLRWRLSHAAEPVPKAHPGARRSS